MNQTGTHEHDAEQDTRRRLRMVATATALTGGPLFLLPAAWLLTNALVLVHAGAQEVRAGRIEESDALHLLTVTVRDLFTGPGPR